MKIVPSDGWESNVSNLNNSVFPDPFDPHRPKISPCLIPTLTLLTALNLPMSKEVYTFVKFISRTGSLLLFTRSRSALTSGSTIWTAPGLSHANLMDPLFTSLSEALFRGSSRGSSVLTLICKKRLYSQRITKANATNPWTKLITMPLVVALQSNGSTTWK